jgi:subtilisin-like proprotein convertase family protein
MFTRCSKWFLLSALIIAVAYSLPCQGSQAVVISRDFDLPIPSPDDPDSEFGKGRMADANINVTEHLSIEDLDVAISLKHDSFYDLQIVLQSPVGTTITLNPSFNDTFMIRGPDGRYQPVGGSNRFLFDDEAAIGIENATPPLSQAFRPAAGFKLSAFDGQDAFGTWRVQIQDLSPRDTGQLERVELIINAPEPTSGCLFGLAIVVARLIRSRKAA